MFLNIKLIIFTSLKEHLERIERVNVLKDLIKCITMIIYFFL